MTDNRRYLWILTLLTGSFLFGQDQRIADSLIVLYESESYPGNRLELLETIAEEETDPEEALRYSELLIANSTEDSLAPYRYSGYLQKGNALARLGKLDEALEAFFPESALAFMAFVVPLGEALLDALDEIGEFEHA